MKRWGIAFLWVAIVLSVPNGAGAQAVSFIRHDYPVGSYPERVAVGDLNGDGIPDLAVANGLGNTVTVLFGRGDGLFHAPVDFTVGAGPTAVAVGNVNRDGHQDLVVCL